MLVVRTLASFMAELLDDSCRDARGEGSRRDVPGDDGVGSDDGAATDRAPAEHRDAGAEPDIVLDDDSLSREALFHKGASRIVKDVVHGHDLYHRRDVDAIADGDAALSPHHRIFAQQAVTADRDAGVRKSPKVVDVQDGAMIIPESTNNSSK